MDKKILKRVIVANLDGVGENVDDGERFHYAYLSEKSKSDLADYIIEEYEQEIIKERANKIREILE